MYNRQLVSIIKCSQYYREGENIYTNTGIEYTNEIIICAKKLMDIAIHKLLTST